MEPSSLMPVRIGVLANRGYEEALERWTRTADYLTDKIKGYQFEIVPLNFDEIERGVSRGEIDFLFANSSYYIEMEALYRVERILTVSDSQLSVFGGVIFCRADRKDINTLEDLKGKSFMGADYKSLGGWRAAWGTLREHGIDPYKDFARLEFAGTHRAVPLAVKAGKVEAGTVRTDTLERMERLGLIDTESFRIINRQTYKGFPYLISTQLYPEWPFSKLSHTPNDLAKKVAIELLQLSPDSLPCKVAGIDGWTIPLDYHTVAELLKQLRLGPYKDYGKISLSDAIRQYWYLIVLVVVTLAIMAVSSAYIAKLNRALYHSNATLKHEVTARKAALERLEQLNVTLAQERDRSQGYLDVVGVMVVALNEDGLVVLINRKGCELLGYQEHEILNKNWFDICVPKKIRED
ncbi:MAG: PhnD/SsuA/transferrin family substrate-binding protein, partial [Pseudomonadota bacterium]